MVCAAIIPQGFFAGQADHNTLFASVSFDNRKLPESRSPCHTHARQPRVPRGAPGSAEKTDVARAPRPCCKAGAALPHRGKPCKTTVSRGLSPPFPSAPCHVAAAIHHKTAMLARVAFRRVAATCPTRRAKPDTRRRGGLCGGDAHALAVRRRCAWRSTRRASPRSGRRAA